MPRIRIREREKLTYNQMCEYKNNGRELCGYVRQPSAHGEVLYGLCSLDHLVCETIFNSHKTCERCPSYLKPPKSL